MQTQLCSERVCENSRKIIENVVRNFAHISLYQISLCILLNDDFRFNIFLSLFHPYKRIQLAIYNDLSTDYALVSINFQEYFNK